MACGSPIILQKKKKVVIFQSAIVSDFVIVPQNLREKFKLIYPLCNTCMKAGNHFINGQLEKKINKKNKKQTMIDFFF